MGCNCNHSVPGTNCQCSIPIELARAGLKGDTGSQGNAGADGVATLHNQFVVPAQTGVYAGTMATYSFDPTLHLSVNGDKIKIIVVFEVTSGASGTMGIYFGGNLLGDQYIFVPGPAKQLKMEIIVNRVGASTEVIDQSWAEVPSTTGDSATNYAYPFSNLSVSLLAALNITINATQTVIGETIYVRQFSIERMKLTV